MSRWLEYLRRPATARHRPRVYGHCFPVVFLWFTYTFAHFQPWAGGHNTSAGPPPEPVAVVAIVPCIPNNAQKPFRSQHQLRWQLDSLETATFVQWPLDFLETASRLWPARRLSATVLTLPMILLSPLRSTTLAFRTQNFLDRNGTAKVL